MPSIRQTVSRLIQGQGPTFIRFCIVGTINIAIDFTLFLLLYYHLHLEIVAANILSASAGIVNSYLLNRAWTFRAGKGRSWRNMAMFFIVYGMSAMLGSGIVWGLSCFLPAYVAKLATIGFTTGWNYTGSRYMVFREPSGPAGGDRRHNPFG